MDQIVTRAAIFVKLFFEDNNHPELTYHNLEHTQKVVRHATEICLYHDLGSNDRQIVQIAAWFHDTGYLVTGRHDHEEASVMLMRKFIDSWGLDPVTIQDLTDCVMSTQMPTHPTNLREEIICDADTYHLGTAEFWESDMAVRLEVDSQYEISDIEWSKRSLHFLEQHIFYTDYCRQKLNEGKRKNMLLLREKVKNG